MKFTEVPISKLLPPSLMFTDLDVKKHLALKHSISETGVILPIIVWENGDKFVVVDGWKRVELCKELNAPVIPAVVLEEKDVNQMGDKMALEGVVKTKSPEAILGVVRLWLNDIHGDIDFDKFGRYLLSLKDKYDLADMLGEDREFITASMLIVQEVVGEDTEVKAKTKRTDNKSWKLVKKKKVFLTYVFEQEDKDFVEQGLKKFSEDLGEALVEVCRKWKGIKLVSE